MSDIYKAPDAELTSGEEHGAYGSLEKGVAGDYSLSIGEVIGEAWRRTKGNKGTIWLGVLCYIVAAAAINFIAGLVSGYPAFDPQAAIGASLVSQLIYQVLVAIAGAPLLAGMMMIGIKIARDESVSGTEVFSHFDKILPLAVGMILMYILGTLGFILLILPGIYLMVAYTLAMPLIVDKGLGPWAALETSRKAITKHWFGFFGFLIVCLLLYIAGAIPLMIGLIWVIPLVSIAVGIAYRNIFGGPESDQSA
ncbi:hypothetical protein [Microbulbifer litoralis]|uniref:hypothetical protein n=1 Tax=Microbulbifer litoralis TaxID=2933965 RepID=UPI0020288CAA|nr:hypothetical protein [Microbulbifer sp. GX H0434]